MVIICIVSKAIDGWYDAYKINKTYDFYYFLDGKTFDLFGRDHMFLMN